MADPKEPPRDFLESGLTLFVLGEEAVYVLGDDGTEALIPYEDLSAFFQHLARTLLAEPGPALDDEDQEP